MLLAAKAAREEAENLVMEGYFQATTAVGNHRIEVILPVAIVAGDPKMGIFVFT